MIEPTNWWRTKLVSFLAAHTPKCHDITRLVSNSMEHPLPLRTRLSMRVHFLICVWCERYRDQLLLVRKTMRSRDRSSDRLSSEARNRLQVALEKDQGAGPSRSG